MTELEKAIAEMEALVLSEMMAAANLMDYIEEVKRYAKDGDPYYLSAAVRAIGMRRHEHVTAKGWYKNQTRERELWNRIYEAVKEEKGL